MLTIFSRGGALACVSALALAAPATAADAVKPVPCQGLLIEDAVDDQVVDPSGGFGVESRKGEPNLDIENVFMTYRNGKDGKPVLSANIQIQNLDKTVPAESSGGVYYYVSFTYGGVNHFVKAWHTGDEVQYAHGTYDASSQVFIVYNTDDVATSGAFFEGPHGVVQIDIPAEVGGKPGETLSGVYADADIIQGADDFFGSNVHADSAPDGRDEGAAEYTVAECPAAAPAAAPGNVPDTTSTTPAADAGSGGSSQQQQQGGGRQETRSSQSEALPFGAPKVLGSARRARKGRRLSISVRAGKPITGLVVQLKARNGKGRALATGRLSRLSGTKKLSLKFARTLKKGRYALVATGTVDGRKLTATQLVGLR